MFSEAELFAAIEWLTPSDADTGHLTARSRSLLLTALRTARKVMRRPGAYSDLEARLLAAEGPAAVQLQAALMLLQGPQASAGDVGKFGGKSGIQFRKSDNRNAILETALAVLYTPLLDNTTGRNNATAQMVNPAEEAYQRRALGED